MNEQIQRFACFKTNNGIIHLAAMLRGSLRNLGDLFHHTGVGLETVRRDLSRPAWTPIEPAG